MRILAVDTSTHVSSVAVLRDGQVLFEDASEDGRKHGEVLLPRVQAGLQAAGMTLEQVELVAAGVGPGSFTGLRVGLSTAKGLALALGTPVRGVVSLEALALGGAGEGQLVAPILDAYRGEVFAALYEVADGARPAVLLEPFCALPQVAAARLQEVAAGRALRLCGNGLVRYGDEFEAAVGSSATCLGAEYAVPLGRHLARLAEQGLLDHGPDDSGTLEPLYIRDTDAKLPDVPLKL